MWLLALAAIDIAPNGTITIAVHPSARPGEAALSDLSTYLGRMTSAKVAISQAAEQLPSQARMVIAPLAGHVRLRADAGQVSISATSDAPQRERENRALQARRHIGRFGRDYAHRRGGGSRAHPAPRPRQALVHTPGAGLARRVRRLNGPPGP